ncbi:MAG TPA: response regulator [Candidatus Bathyarchaeia archaeon]|nr:response regulator [Candidatus Bathyarchaeia archaeon]
MSTSSIRVLVVDDYEPWVNFATKTLRGKLELRVVGEASDGLEAVQKAQGLQPDLILLDIGLPTINGIQAARRILQHSPKTKILFVSEQRSPDIVEEALRTGAGGYLVKSYAASELVPAVKALLEGKRFVSASLSAHDSSAPTHGSAITHSHEVAFYADDSSVVDCYARFVEHSLRGGKAVIVVVTESHRASLLPRLEADGVDVSAVIEQGRYFLLDAADTLSGLTVNDSPDPVRCKKVVGDLIMVAAKGVKGEHARVAVCGETAPTLLAKGNVEGAVMLEHLWDKITRGYGIHTLCGYLSSAFPRHEADPIFQRICAKHSKVYSR